MKVYRSLTHCMEAVMYGGRLYVRTLRRTKSFRDHKPGPFVDYTAKYKLPVRNVARAVELIVEAGKGKDFRWTNCLVNCLKQDPGEFYCITTDEDREILKLFRQYAEAKARQDFRSAAIQAELQALRGKR